jgi:hypothetical protein
VPLVNLKVIENHVSEEDVSFLKTHKLQLLQYALQQPSQFTTSRGTKVVMYVVSIDLDTDTIYAVDQYKKSVEIKVSEVEKIDVCLGTISKEALKSLLSILEDNAVDGVVYLKGYDGEVSLNAALAKVAAASQLVDPDDSDEDYDEDEYDDEDDSDDEDDYEETVTAAVPEKVSATKKWATLFGGALGFAEDCGIEVRLPILTPNAIAFEQGGQLVIGAFNDAFPTITRVERSLTAEVPAIIMPAQVESLKRNDFIVKGDEVLLVSRWDASTNTLFAISLARSEKVEVIPVATPLFAGQWVRKVECFKYNPGALNAASTEG